ncbi:EamA-like transporter family protein [Novipirellula galeiformis]|uniref:EamA-like transporter family protein n=1 Tax=Novipirellula galeiformis TaxID=2528004 RepID=A0A5C6CJ14_9BACT|nr:DMT family transporter [Novipirellula galeiformis]TWU23371.1 EamA-like transporter family protein [Novipirellula galeiformis]
MLDLTWIGLAAVSAVLLGCYDVTKKIAVRKNAVPIVLLLSVSVGAAIWLPFIVWSVISPASLPHPILQVNPLSLREHGWLFVKSVLVGASWTFAFFALKRLPLSIAAPIRSTSPIWTIAIAAVFLQERPSGMQWLGIATVLLAFWAFSVISLREGISFSRDRGVAMMIVATLLGALSSIYDKFLLQTILLDPSTLQAWFSLYLVPVMIPMAAIWWRSSRKMEDSEPTIHTLFEWRWAILGISPLLLAADLVYFTALADPEALVSVISVVRRCSVVIAFVFGIRALGEANFWPKAACIATILCGVALLVLGA